MPAAEAKLDEIVKYAQGAFIQAKSDGVLEAGEVVQIAVGVAGKLQALGQLKGSEKKSVVLYCMKKGMDAAGGVGELPGLKEVTAEMRKAVEDQLLAAAGAAIDMAVAVARGDIDLKKHGVKSCLPLCLSAAAVARNLLPKEAAIVKTALSWAEDQGRAYAVAQGVLGGDADAAAGTAAAPPAPLPAPPAPLPAPAAPLPAPAAPLPAETLAPIQESAAPPAAPVAPAEPPAEAAPPATESETAPSLAASPEAAPLQTHEVRFE
jgi:hypothetical protein